MEAKETMMSDEQLDEWCEKRFGKGYMFNKQLLKDFEIERAKISFKAGIRKVVEWVEGQPAMTWSDDTTYYLIDLDKLETFMKKALEGE